MASGKKRRTHNEAYMYDNLVRVRRPQIHQEAGYYEEEARTVSPQTKKNQRRAMKLGFGYVTFFAGAVAVALFVCFHYLGAQADLEQKTRKIESLRTEITSLKGKIHQNTIISQIPSIWTRFSKGQRSLVWYMRRIPRL